MEVRYTIGKNEYKRMTTQELRDTFLVDLFEAGQLNLLYSEVERSIIGAAVPGASALRLEAGKALAADFFCERREIGVLNIGADGLIEVDGRSYSMEHLDALYIGRGSRDITFSSADAARPARFYLVSYPAHAEYPTRQACKADASAIHLGSSEDSNKRTIYQYVHQDGIQSCQLVMGFTVLEPGSVWNTMPCHTHERRTEVYLYFGLDEQAQVFHLLGSSNETRHIAVKNEQAVLSPMWSIHSGCGTKAYSFCWAMGGENKRFDDMDPIKVSELR
jgi:4-deoxy-L-threo-5-hexosulose-uronate ketol-isomerase